MYAPELNRTLPFASQSPFTCEFLGDYFSIGTKYDVWCTELCDDVDRDFLLNGLKYGFRITDECFCDNNQPPYAEMDNHRSALMDGHKISVENELKMQMEEGYYIPATEKPLITSPLGAIEKPGTSDIRIIHDGSMPIGKAMNDYSTLVSVSYETLDDALKLAKPGYYMCKVDLKSAYRSVPIHKDCYPMTGLKWQFEGQPQPTYLFDTRLPFGSRLGPSIFSRLSQAVKRMMMRRGFNGLVVYLDDFWVVSKDYDTCKFIMTELISLLRKLGFRISWSKVVGPTQQLQFLGIDIDTMTCQISLRKEKRDELHAKLTAFLHRCRASKKQLQSLAGLLNWAAQVVRGGKFFLRRILDALKCLKNGKHKIKLSHAFKLDVQWWLTYLFRFNGVSYYNEGPVQVAHADASNNAAGIFWRGDWQYISWEKEWPRAQSLHINYKEVLAIVLAVKRWAPVWANSTVYIHTDSMVAKGILNKGRCHNDFVMEVLRNMFWLTVCFNVKLIFVHVPGVLNVIPDSISRLHERGQFRNLYNALSNWYHGWFPCLNFVNHINFESCVALLSQVLHWLWRQN